MSFQFALRPLITLFSVVAVVGAALVLAASPARADFVFQGNFRISNGTSCLEVYGDQKGNGVPVIQGPCDSGNNQRWSIYRLTDQNNFQFNAYAGEQPLNQCFDGPESRPNIHTWGCHGGSQQRWTLSILPNAPQQIRQAGTNECVGGLLDLSTGVVHAIQQNCASAPNWRLIPA
jgi:hypothetical protein